jgi:glyoxylase-like metal-dependent hydrolase (beta-lactamase superfamily II)
MPENVFEVSVIKPGKLVRDRFGNILDARSTVTLIIGADLKIIVDTGLSEEKQLIIDALASRELRPKNIDILINTHAHIDHTGNNNLFPDARFIAHRKEYWGVIEQNNCEIIRNDKQLLPGLELIMTPGHTEGSITVFVTGYGPSGSARTFAITGDALPITDNYQKWVPPAINIDPKIALWSMKRIVDSSEIVIPGHDKPFKILDRDKRMAEYLK